MFKNGQFVLIFFSNFNIFEFGNICVEFVLENNLIIGPESFRNLLLNNFLNQSIEKEICKEEYFYNDREQKFYIYYECNQIDDFQNKKIYLKNDELNETFILNLDSLFFRYNKKSQIKW